MLIYYMIVVRSLSKKVLGKKKNFFILIVLGFGKKWLNNSCFKK